MLHDLAVGTVVDQSWRIERVLGGGGMGSVYACRHVETEQVAALKIIHAHLASEPTLRARFIAEGNALARVAHAGVVRLLGDGSYGDVPYLVMELAEGENLKKLAAARDGKLSLAEIGPLIEQLLAALEAVHRAGVLHRDVKPENVVMLPDGRIKLVDFGIARIEDAAGVTTTGGFVGTPAFMAPEQVLGKGASIDGRVDLFSVGAVVWRLLTGRNIHDECTGTELLIAMGTRAAPSLATIDRSLPPGIVEFVDRALQFDPNQRFPDAITMRVAWGRAIYGDPAAPPTVRAPEAKQARFAPRTWMTAAALGCLVLVAGGAIAWSMAEGAGSEPPAKRSKKAGRSVADPVSPEAVDKAPLTDVCDLDPDLVLSLSEKVFGKSAQVKVLVLSVQVVVFTGEADGRAKTFVARPPFQEVELAADKETLRLPGFLFATASADWRRYRSLCQLSKKGFEEEFEKPGEVSSVMLRKGNDQRLFWDFQVALGTLDRHYCYEASSGAKVVCGL